MRHSQSLESYLAQIAHELRDLPSQARAEEMREIEAHLRTMIEARGDVAGVLAQFGAPRKVGRDLGHAWERKQPENWINAALALLAGLLIYVASGVIQAKFGHFYLLSQQVDIASSAPFALVKETSPGEILRNFFLYQAAINLVMLIVLGCTTKLISPKRGTLAALPILTLLLLQRIMNSNLDHSSFLFLLVSLIFYCAVNFIAVLIGAKFSKKHQVRIAN